MIPQSQADNIMDLGHRIRSSHLRRYIPQARSQSEQPIMLPSRFRQTGRKYTVRKRPDRYAPLRSIVHLIKSFVGGPRYVRILPVPFVTGYHLSNSE